MRAATPLTMVHTGTCSVAVVKDGFKSYTVQNVLLGHNAEVRVEAGSQTQTVEVTAESAALQTDRSDTTRNSPINTRKHARTHSRSPHT